MRARSRAARADSGREMFVDAVGHEELRVLGPSVAALGEADLLLAERLAVRRGGVLLVWGTVADVAVQDDERRPALRLLEDCRGRARCARCRWRRRPARRSSRKPEPRRDVLREGDARVPLDRDVVVVVDPAEVVQAQVTGQ